MAEKRVVTRRKAVTKKSSGKFNFTREMVPSFANGSQEATVMTRYRDEAWTAFEALELPKTTDEPWRRTDIRRLDTDKFQIAAADGSYPDVPAELLEPLEGDADGGQIVITPGGQTTVTLNEEIAAQGVIFTDLATAATKHPEVLEKVLGAVVKPDEGLFAALAGSFAEGGVLLYVPKGVHVEQPLHSVLWGPGVNTAHFSHLLIYIEDNASATYMHEAASPTEDGQTLHAGIVEIKVGDNANFNFVELQSWGENVWNFTHERARIGRDSNIDWIFGGVGSRLTKSFTELNLDGRGSTARMSGFYFTDGIQHLDHDTQQNHNAADTTSDLLFKGALEGNSRSVWQGMIYVAPGAQKSDGYQHNPNLVLSTNARADSIPGLEILADDVRCTHGATIGRVEDEELFYLLSRGIPRKLAERLIVDGFFDPIMQRIPFENVRERFRQAIEDKMARAAELD